MIPQLSGKVPDQANYLGIKVQHLKKLEKCTLKITFS